jgi:hypothetical protein
MNRKCKLRHRETGEEYLGMRDDDKAYLSNGQVADFEFWEIVEPMPRYLRAVLSIAALIGAVFLGFLFWGEQ